MKTNAARILEGLSIAYTLQEYEVDPEDLSAINVARKIGLPVEQVFKTLSYFDGVNFAARAHAPALFSVALMDAVCPPATVFAAYNAYTMEMIAKRRADPTDDLFSILVNSEVEGQRMADDEIVIRSGNEVTEIGMHGVADQRLLAIEQEVVSVAARP